MLRTLEMEQGIEIKGWWYKQTFKSAGTEKNKGSDLIDKENWFGWFKAQIEYDSAQWEF